MKVGDTYGVFIEVSPGQYEKVAEAAIKRFNKDDNLVDLVVPSTLVTMQTKVELDTAPPTPEPVGNAHVLLGTEGPENSPGVDTQPVIPQAPEAPVAPAQAAPVQVVQPNTATPVDPGTAVVPTPVQTPETQQPSAEVAPVVSDPSAPPVEH